MAWDFSTDPDFQRKLDWMDSFVREEIFPLEVLDLSGDQFRLLTAPLKDRVKEEGLWAAHLDPELGGQGFGQVKLALMHEILGKSVFAPLVFGNQAPDSGNSEILALCGTAEQKDRWLYPLLDGRLRSCFAMTEPAVAGADPTLIETTAVLNGAAWVLNGLKWYSSNASVADFFVVMAVTDADAPPRNRASMIVVDADTPGIEVSQFGTMEHPHPTPDLVDNHGEMVQFRDVRVPVENLLGERGQGFKIAQQRLGPGRIHHCMRWLGQARRAFDMLCERSLYRYAHGSLLSEKQTVQNWIADSLAEMTAARLVTLHAAWIMDTQGQAAARKEVSLIKFWGAKVLHDVIDRAIQVHGGLGYSTELPLEEMYRRARAARIYDGPDEVHRQSVARLVLRDYTPPADGVPTEFVPARREDAIARFAAILEEETANL
jgi:acyl-CoA dehydrogenase